MVKKALKVLGITLAVLGVLVLTLVLAVRFFFPNDALRQRLEQVLSERVQGTARIASLEFDLLSGLDLRQVEIFKDRSRLVHLGALTLRYNLWHLLHGELVINELVLTRAQVSLDLQELGAKAPTAPEAPPPSGPAQLPTIPVALDLQSLRVENAEVAIRSGPELAVTLRAVDLRAELKAGPRTVELAGSLTIPDTTVALAGRVLRLPLASEFKVGADLSAERLEVTTLRLSSDPTFRVGITGRIDDVLTARKISLSLENTEINLEHVLRVAGGFLPDGLADVRLAGTVSPTVSVQGTLGGQGFDGQVGVEVLGVNVQGALPAAGARLGPTTFRLLASEVPVRANVPQSLRAELSLATAAAEAQSHALRDTTLRLMAQHAVSGEFAAALSVDGEAALPAPAGVRRRSLPIHLGMEASGNAKTLTVSIPTAIVRVGKLAALKARGEMVALAQTPGDRDVTVKVVLDADLPEMLALVPREHLGEIKLAETSSTETVTLDLKGTLDPQFQPRRADLAGTVTLSGLKASAPKVGARGTVESMQVQFQGTYLAPRRDLTGRVSGRLALADLAHQGSLTLGRTVVTLESRLHGRFSSAWRPLRFASKDLLTVAAQGVRYADAALKANLGALGITARTRTDVVEGAYRLDQLRVRAGSIFDVTAKGDYRTKGRRFEVDLSLPSLDIEALRKHVSGPAVQVVADLKPRGTLSLLLRGKGTIPDVAQLQTLELPLALSGSLALKDVTAAFYDRRVVGATGSVTVSLAREERQRARVAVHVRADEVHLGEGSPLARVTDVAADADLTSDGFESVRLERVRLGINGATLTLDGVLAGLRRFLERREEPLLAKAGRLFVNLRSTAEVDLDQFEEVASAFGVQGSGRLGLTVGVLKKDRGPIDVQVGIRPERVTVSRDTMRVVDLDGSIAVRKVLQWQPSTDGLTPNSAFSPTTVLPELRAYAPQRQELRIKRIDVGSFKISDFAVGIQFDRDRLVAQNLAMNLLGGGLGGSVELTSGKAFRVTARLEAARLDVNHLLQAGQRVRGDSLVDGTVHLTAAFEPETGGLDFGESRLDLSITRIGKDGLDRLLRFLDPEGSNPSIVSARSAVKLANPSHVRVTLFKGLLGLQIGFQEGLLSRFEMDRIPVSRIKQFRNLTRAVPNWERVRDLMQLLGAARYGLDQEGHLVLE